VILEPDGSIAQIGSDEEIIRNPVNRFVFQFIGVSNFIPVVVDDGKVFFDLETKIPFRSQIHGKMTGTKAMLGIRPMDIMFDDDSPVRATVAQSVFLGNRVLIPLAGSGTRGDQVENAEMASQAGAAVCLAGEKATPEAALSALLGYLDNADAMAKASASALALSGVRTENGESATSADYIAGLILEALKRATGGTR